MSKYAKDVYLFTLALMASVLFFCWVGCSRDAAIRNSIDAARAVCCLAHIKEGKTPEAAEAVCTAVEAVSPFIERTERAATSEDGGLDDAGRAD